MSDKYKLIEEKNLPLKRIVALRSIPSLGVRKGQKGGLLDIGKYFWNYISHSLSWRVGNE